MADELQEEEVEVTFDNVFDDITLDEPVAQTSGEDEKADPVKAELEETTEETPEEGEPEEKSEEETKQEETKPEDKKEKTSGLDNVRKFGERQKARADELETKLSETNSKLSVFEEYGGIDEVAKVVTEFGGIAQAKVGVELSQIFADSTSEPDVLIERARAVAPDVVDGMISHVAETLASEIHTQVTKNIFGKIPTKEEEAAVREFLIYGTKSEADDLPEELTQDEFGNKLPDKVINAIRHARESERKTTAALKALEDKINGKFQQIETKEVTNIRTQFMNESFAVIGEKLDALGLSKPIAGESKEEAESRFEKAGALNALTFHFFQADQTADKALSEAEKLLGRQDKLSKAKLEDLNKIIQRKSRQAADKAASILAPTVTSAATKVKAAVAKQTATKITAGNTQRSRTVADADDVFGDLTLDTLNL